MKISWKWLRTWEHNQVKRANRKALRKQHNASLWEQAYKFAKSRGFDCGQEECDECDKPHYDVYHRFAFLPHRIHEPECLVWMTRFWDVSQRVVAWVSLEPPPRGSVGYRKISRYRWTKEAMNGTL